MINKRNNYNLIAPLYHFFSRVVFGKQLDNIQINTFPWIPNEGEILFVGGGSGIILEKILKEKPKIKITYLDKSEKMIDLAKKRLNKNDIKRVVFITNELENFQPTTDFDFVLTYFFLDQFNDTNREIILKKIDDFLVPDGSLIIADFSLPKTVFQKFIEKLMFAFLKISTRIESGQIEALNDEMDKYEYRRKEYLQHKKINLFAAVYQKKSSKKQR